MINLTNVKYFQGKTVWLTGASSGIGKSLAIDLAKHGASLILTARSHKKLEELRQNLHNKNDHMVLACDLSKESEIEKSWNLLLDKNVVIDVLISNAGCSQRSLATETNVETSRYLMEINYFAPLKLMTFVLPKMIENNSGHLIVVSSLMGKIATPLRSSYAAAKHALVGYFESLITENYNSPIKFTMINPGFIDTNMSKNSLKGDGSISNDISKSRNKITSADDCAKKIISASSKGSREVYIGGPEVYIALVKRLFPNLFFKLITRVSATR